MENRFEEYPKLRELIKLKDELIAQTATPPMYLKCDLETFDLRDLDSKFDVILLEPPLEEYQRSVGLSRDHYWSWDMVRSDHNSYSKISIFSSLKIDDGLVKRAKYRGQRLRIMISIKKTISQLWKNWTKDKGWRVSR